MKYKCTLNLKVLFARSAFFKTMKMSASSSTEWYLLPEAASAQVWWKDHSTSMRDNNGSTLQPVFVSTTSTPHTDTQVHMSAHDQISQTADLTITSLLTISPPRQSPGTKICPPTVSSCEKPLTIPTPQQSPRTLDQLQGDNKATNFNHTHTAVPSSPSDCLQGHPLSSQNSASSLGSRPPSSHSQKDVTACTDPLPRCTTIQSTSTYSTSSVPDGRHSPIDTALLTKQMSLLELDKLWCKFLKSSLLAKGKENTPACTCTCKVSSAPPTSMKKDQLSLEHTSPSNPLQFPTLGSSSSFECSGSSVTLELVDRSVQTTKTDLHSVPAAFTVPRTTHSRKDKPMNTFKQPVSSSAPHTTHLPPTKQPTVSSSSASPPLHQHPASSDSASTLSQFVVGPLSLSEAFALRRPDFILRSQRRERRVREMSNMRVESARMSGNSKAHGQHEINRCYWKPAQPQTVCSECKLKERSKSLYYVKMGQGTRPRMSHKKMYQATKKAWEKLPEVKRKAAEEKRRLEAETNRIRVKLYQKEVLARMRKGSARQK